MIHSINKDYLLDTILEHCDDLITITDLNMRYVACNKSFIEHFGFSDYSNVIGKTIYEIFPKDAEFIENSIREVIKTQEPCMCKIDIQSQNTNKIVRQTNSPIIRNGVLEGILSISTDMTQEENLKVKLMEKVYQFNALLECLPLLVYMKNKNKEIIWGSESSRAFVNDGYDRFAGNIHLNPDSERNTDLEEDDYVLKNKKVLITEKMFTDYNNNPHWYKVYKSPILSDTDEVQGLVTIAENIDEEKMTENRKNLFLATLGHDLKNPLLAQINSLELLHKGTFGELNCSQKEMLEMTIESSVYMRDMLYSLLKTCKESNGIIKLERTNFDLNKLMRKCIQEVTDFARNKNIKIISEIDSKTDLFYGDECEIRRVIGNLLNNAVNYAFENSVIKINLGKKDHFIQMSFENCSAEIPPDLRKHIFDKYVCDNSLKSSFSVGLGLYFCKKVVEAHEGVIYVDAHGTKNTFRVKLPVLDEKSVIISEVVL